MLKQISQLNISKKIILSLGLFLACLILGQVFSSKQAYAQVTFYTSDYTPYKTIAKRVLDIENQEGFEVSETVYNRLDEIINTATHKIQEQIMEQETYAIVDAIMILDTIKSVLDNTVINESGSCFLACASGKTGFTYGPAFTLRTGLERGCLEANEASYIYLSIADKIGFPLYGVLGRNGIFLRFDNDGNFDLLKSDDDPINSDGFNYQMPYAIKKGNYYFVTQFANTYPIENGNFLRKLNEDEIAAVAYTNIVRVQLLETRYPDCVNANSRKTYLDRSKISLHIALDFNPKYLDAYYYLGELLIRKGECLKNPPIGAYLNLPDNSQATSYFEEALQAMLTYKQVLPDSISVKYNLGIAYYNLKGIENFQKAKTNFEEYLEEIPEEYRQRRFLLADKAREYLKEIEAELDRDRLARYSRFK